MTLPDILQSAFASSGASAVTSLTVTFSNPIRSQGGAISPSALGAFISYDGNTGSLCTGATDSEGNTWQVANDGTNDSRISNGAGVNGEAWYAIDAVGGNATSVTFTFSSAVKVRIGVFEIDQVNPKRGLDRVKSNINTTASTSRIGLSGTKGRGMLRVTVGGVAWNNATLTCTGVPVSYKSFSQLKDGDIGVGLSCKATETKNLNQGQVVARFNMSAGTTPVALMSLSFWRDGVVNVEDDLQDGTIDNIETVPTLYTNPSVVFGGNWLYSSSTSAPGGGTGSSEKSQVFSFLPDYSPYLKTGVTIGNSINVYFQALSGGNDDLTGYMGCYIDVYKSLQLGTTLDITDESRGTGDGGQIPVGTTPCTAGEFSITIDKATQYNTSGVTAFAMAMLGDTQGGASGTWAYIGDYSGNQPAYAVLVLDYPVIATSTPQMNMSGVGT